MRVLAAILTHRPAATGRLELLAQTFKSLSAGADAVWVVDNGSGPDEVAAITERLGVAPWTHNGPVTTCGHGTNLQARILAGAAEPGDICVHSDDDMLWSPDWAEKLCWWWSCGAQRDVLLTGCHVEPIYEWNAIEGAVGEYWEDEAHYPGALYRASTGAASWSYRAEDAHLIFPIPEKLQGTGDVPACAKVRQFGRIAQLDLAEHVGAESTWGNRTVEMFGWDTAPALEILRGAA